LHPESGVLESSVKPSLGKPGQACLPMLGLTEDSRTTDFRLGLLVLIAFDIGLSIKRRPNGTTILILRFMLFFLKYFAQYNIYC